MTALVSGNSVLALRKQRLALATRPFLARGYKVQRCELCLLPLADCICASKPAQPDADCAVLLLMYGAEMLKPSNTGRLIADIINENYAFRWSRTEPEPELLALLADPRYQPFVVFPADNLPEQRVTFNVARQSGKKPLFIFLDGTWREAKKMIRKSPYLDPLPVLAVSPDQLSQYKLRVAHHDHHLCTAEVATMVLNLAQEYSASQALLQHFEHFRDAYLSGKNSWQDVNQ